MGETIENYKTVRLGDLAGGIVEELFQNELEKALANVADVNVPWKPARKITIELSIMPEESREQAVVAVKINSKLPGIRPYASTFFMARRGNKISAFEHNLKQAKFEFNEENKPVVRLPYREES